MALKIAAGHILSRYGGDGDYLHHAYVVIVPGAGIFPMKRLRGLRDIQRAKNKAGQDFSSVLIVTDDSDPSGTLLSDDVCAGIVSNKHTRHRIDKFRPFVDYKVFVAAGEMLVPVSIHWRVLDVTEQSLAARSAAWRYANAWIAQKIDNGEGNIAVCCHSGEKQCAALSAAHLMYSNRWSLNETRSYLSRNLYNGDIDPIYLAGLAEYESWLAAQRQHPSMLA